MPLLQIAGIPVEFILFALTLLGVALFHNRTFYVAIAGVITISLYKIFVTGFKTGPGVAGWLGHMQHEWVTLANLFCLLMGFALLSRHFEKSHVPVILPKYLPDDWKGMLAAITSRATGGDSAEISARRLEGRFRHAGDGFRSFQLSRQHRGGADRRRHGAPVVQGQGAYRLPGRSRAQMPAAPAAWSATPPP